MKAKQPNTYKVRLTFFHDDATGDYGLAHDNAINKDFNAFWTGQGIFHDVFEHYFEENHKYFKDIYGFNIGGEICAMGHLAYYWERFRPNNRRINPKSMHSFESNIAHTTINDMEEAITYGYTRFGSRLESAVPKQKPVNSCILDTVINEHLYCMDNAHISDKCDEIAIAKDFKRSVTDNKIINLYTYGYKLAEQIAPDTEHNKKTIIDFIDYWNEFCDRHIAEDMANEFIYLEFTITTGEELKWTAEFITQSDERFTPENVSEIY